MPPKCKFTKEEIIQAAFEMVRTEGFSELTARALGGRLGSSPKPIFSIFTSMEEVQEEVIGAAKSCMQNMWREDLGKHLHSVALVHSIFSLPSESRSCFRFSL